MDHNQNREDGIERSDGPQRRILGAKTLFKIMYGLGGFANLHRRYAYAIAKTLKLL